MKPSLKYFEFFKAQEAKICKVKEVKKKVQRDN